MRIFFATHNEDKLREVREILCDFPGEIKSKKEAGEEEDVLENGSSFSENAEIKARALYNALRKKGILQKGDIVMADDSGLSIEALSYGPGIYSARFLGENTPYPEKNRKILAMLEEATNKSRYAFYTCAIVAVFYDGQVFNTEAKCEGEIAKEEKGLEGFGYDPIFFIPDFGKTAAELSREEKNSISHRGKALRKMMRLLQEKLLFQDGMEEREEKKTERSEKKKEDIVVAREERKILVVSDNHRKLDALFKVIDANPDIVFFLHLGDSEGTEEEIRARLPKGCESYFVQGNNDFFAYLPKEAELRLGKEKLFLTHGHLYSVNMDLQRLAEEARDRNCSMAVFGHTHKPCSKVVNGVHCFNPGSIAYPRQEDRRPSYGLFYLDKKGNLRSEIKYFG